MPRASLRSVLLICAFSTAGMCRVSTQTTNCFGESAKQPLRQWPSLQSNPLEVVDGVRQHRQQSFRLARTFTSRTILPVSSTMQTLISLTDTSSPAKWSMLRFSFDAQGEHDLFSPSA